MSKESPGIRDDPELCAPRQGRFPAFLRERAAFFAVSALALVLLGIIAFFRGECISLVLMKAPASVQVTLIRYMEWDTKSARPWILFALDKMKNDAGTRELQRAVDKLPEWSGNAITTIVLSNVVDSGGDWPGEDWHRRVDSQTSLAFAWLLQSVQTEVKGSDAERQRIFFDCFLKSIRLAAEKAPRGKTIISKVTVRRKFSGWPSQPVRPTLRQRWAVDQGASGDGCLGRFESKGVASVFTGDPLLWQPGLLWGPVRPRPLAFEPTTRGASSL